MSVHLLQRLPSLFLLLLTLLANTAIADESVSQGDVLQVKVRSTALRGEPKAWASPLGTANYGDKLTVVALGGGWVKVKSSSGKVGYVHTSAITTKKVVLGSSGLTDTSADPTEVVMAGKGFSKKVEESYSATTQGLNFSAVNGMERWKVSSTELASFLKAGKLGEWAK